MFYICFFAIRFTVASAAAFSCSLDLILILILRGL